MNHSTMTKALLLCALAAGTVAHAANDSKQVTKGPKIGKASVDDVKLDKFDADKLAFSTINPMQYGGNTAGFANVFGTNDWEVLGTQEAKTTLVDSSDLFDFTFTGAGGTSGTWTITNTGSRNAVLDLTVAIHASKASTAFLFDDQAVAAGQTLNGTWQIEWLNGGGQVPGFSNVVFFGRDIASPVPEPHVLPMTLAGLAVLGTAAWRRRGKGSSGNVA